jgi:hypothetical protein
MADQGNDLGVESLDILKRQHPCLFFLAIGGSCCDHPSAHLTLYGFD